jgi:uncharacterized membrane protein
MFWKYRYYLLVFFVSLFPLVPFFITSDLVHTSDGLVHIPRIAAFFKSLLDGQFPVRWAGDLNYGYGMPIFSFMYQLPYLISSLFIALGFGLVSSFKLTLAISFIFSGVFMYLFAKEFFKDEKKAFLVTLLYQFAPFHLVELIVRGSFGELFTYTFLPLVLYGVVRLERKYTWANFSLVSLATFLLVISHNAVSLAFFGIVVLFVLFFISFKKWAICFSALLCGLGLSAYYFIPAIIEHKYTLGDVYMQDLYKSNFAPWYYFFIPNILKSETFRMGAVSMQFGLFHVLAIIVGIYMYVKKKKDSSRIIFFNLLLIGISLFFMQPISIIFWEQFSLLRQFQFPWRLLSVVAFATSFLGVVFFKFKLLSNKTVFSLVCFLIIFSTAFYWVPQEGFDKVNENYYKNFPLTTTYYGETDVIWTAGEFKAYPKSPVETIEGVATISNYKKKSNIHTYTVLSQGESKLVDHTEYFPGWKVYVNGKQTLIEFQDQNYRGEITFFVPSGQSDVRVVFGESPIRAIANGITIVTGIGLIGLFLYYKKYQR